jgi:hypothetical protein
VQPVAGQDGQRGMGELAVAEDHQAWLARSRVVLTPLAAPSIMGLFGFMIATVMLGAWQAGWYGTAKTPLVIWPFALVAGGPFIARSPARPPTVDSRPPALRPGSACRGCRECSRERQDRDMH